MSVTVVGVDIELNAYHFDKLYSYFVPSGMTVPAVGCRVVVPFGGGNTHRNGFVLSVSSAPSVEKLKPLRRIVDTTPLITPELTQLAIWMKEHTFCCYYDALKLMLPAGLQMQMAVQYSADPLFNGDLQQLEPHLQQLVMDLQKKGVAVAKEKLITTYGLSSDGEELDRLTRLGFLQQDREAVRRMGDATLKVATLLPLDESQSMPSLTPKQRLVYDLLAQVGSAGVKEICYFTGVTPVVLQGLAKKGLIEFTDQEVFRTPEDDVKQVDSTPITLNQSQQKAYDTLLGLLNQEKGAAALLYGVTGSGKTSVYLKLIDQALVQKPHHGIIVMVPEISLTPQAVAIFKRRYGKGVAIFHSRLSLGERLDEWKRVKTGLAQIVIGTRSAVFAPFENLSLIVIDEEQEHTYKSESSPRFHARDAARFRAAHQNALLVLASATPSLESYAKAQAGTYTLCRMEERYGTAVLPQVELLDMRDEHHSGNLSAFSEQLLNLLQQQLQKGKQSILLLNRRGYHTFVGCSSCGTVLECPECSISMTYHRDNGRLMCHYCGHSIPLPEQCPSCGGEMMKMAGIGTQKAEEQLQRLLPEARILRMDADSTLTKTAHSEKLTAFANGDYDILLGTQMVAKGLDFPNVSLVGVLNGDQMLHNNDYRAYERGFALLTQVIGRAGRADSEGQAVIQTCEPDHELIELAKRQDYEAFFTQEMSLRKLMEYPPYCDICVVGITGANHEKTKDAAFLMAEIIKKRIQTDYPSLPVKLLGPAPAQVVKVGGKYRYRIIIKCKNSKPFREMLASSLVNFGTQKGLGGVTAFADINPEGFL
ncbi:MAG: primosomal protein N' [Clostridia bacterium]|nr:primosomal protein N' [Clostridia bacterium]